MRCIALVEAARVELASETKFLAGSPSAACDHRQQSRLHRQSPTVQAPICPREFGADPRVRSDFPTPHFTSPPDQKAIRTATYLIKQQVQIRYWHFCPVLFLAPGPRLAPSSSLTPSKPFRPPVVNISSVVWLSTRDRVFRNL